MLTRSPPVQFDREKLKEAVWLIAEHCPPEELGNVKLHKTLYFADMMAYIDTAHPITGVEYQKQKFGPTARYLSSALRDLETEGKIETREQNYYGFAKKEYVSLRRFEKERLSDEEIALILDVADFVRGKSAREISELSHMAAWDAAELGEVLPYFSALWLLPEEVTEADRDWAVETARTYASQRP